MCICAGRFQRLTGIGRSSVGVRGSARFCSRVNQVAGTDMTVMVLGETGTGKELVARAVHGQSERRERPLVKVNCSALPGELIESELFGHEKGAFTGATGRQVGRFELADGGTIFLDEVGDLPLKLQAKLLRVLQEGEFERLGSGKTIKVDVRVIAATNRNLVEATAKGKVSTRSLLSAQRLSDRVTAVEGAGGRRGIVGWGIFAGGESAIGATI